MELKKYKTRYSAFHKNLKDAKTLAHKKPIAIEIGSLSAESAELESKVYLQRTMA